jgi:DNA polymerase-3 subunit gamma/tau
MTLLRLLAFTPEREQMSQGPGTGNGSGNGTGNGSGNVAPRVPAAETSLADAEPSHDSPTTEAKAPVVAAGSDAERWYAIWYAMVDELSLGGVAKMIAEHSMPVSFSDSAIMLVLSREHDTLLNDAQVQNLQRGLSEVAGKNVSVSVEVGEPAAETPAQRKVRLRAERQAEAEVAMREDATVQSLLADFDGKLEEVHLH